jgi:NTE family protein
MPRTVEAADKPTIVLALQGGGALGAYHIGAYEALVEKGFAPGWFAGTSIGAINAAILAGNKPEARLERLAAFWEAISRPSLISPSALGPLRLWFDAFNIEQAIVMGQPHFFEPRLLPTLPGPPQKVSFYDTAPLQATLPDFVDFGLINARQVRLSLGATNVETGELEFFDNVGKQTVIEPAHVVASGSLPPGFAATKIGEKFYWDGGVVANTPLEAVLEDLPPGRTIAFVIDLWNLVGPAPHNINEVLWREKQIQFASRTALHLDAIATKVELRHAMTRLEPALTAAAAVTPGQRLDIVHIIYHPEGEQLAGSDTEFSRGSIAERRAAGHRDLLRALALKPWDDEAQPILGAAIHRVAGGQVASRYEPDLRTTTGRPPAMAPR